MPYSNDDAEHREYQPELIANKGRYEQDTHNFTAMALNSERKEHNGRDGYKKGGLVGWSVGQKRVCVCCKKDSACSVCLFIIIKS